MDVRTLRDTVAELKNEVSGARIDKISQLDPHTLTMRVYAHGARRSLVISVLKKSPRFHLLFRKIDGSWLYSGSAADVLRKYLSRGRIRDVGVSQKRVCLSVERDVFYRLVVDFSDLNIGLFTGDGSCVFLLNAKSSMDISGDCNSYGDLPGNPESLSSLTHNRELSEQFFSERGLMMMRGVLRDVKTAEKKIMRLLKKLDAERAEAEQKDRYRKFGELLKYNMHLIPRGESEVLLTDFSGEKVRVGLDPRLDPRENMEGYFAKYKKMKRRAAVIDKNIRVQQEKLAGISDLKQRLEDGSLVVDLSSSSNSLPAAEKLAGLSKQGVPSLRSRIGQVSKKRKSAEGSGSEFLQFTSRTGKKILVGRNAVQNELLTVKKARGNDLWFHAESAHGSHVVLRSEKNSGFRDEDIIDAAMLALHFSKMRAQDRGSVQYTYCKYVRKPKNAKTGMVVIHNEKTRDVRIDQGILKQLLDSGKRH
jgi:predicted ribosome quality control (RQC) complex YloA/Tae2 family protein